MSSINSGVFAHLFDGLPGGWLIEPLADAVNFQEGPGILAVDFHDSGVPLLRLSSIAGPVTTFEGCNYLDPEKVENKWSHFKLEEGDILLSTSGSLGRVSVVAKEQEGSICYTGIIRFRPKTKGLRYPYIKYFLQSKLFEQQALASAAGSVLSHFGPSHLKQMSFPVPPESHQEFIEKQIAPIDSKIQLNRQINQTLEQIAQAIFKSWFVDFEPVKAKIQAKQALTPTLSQRERELFVERAAMRVISGKTDEQLEQLSPKQHQQLAATAALFPDELEDTELGEIPMGWGVKTIEDVTSLIIDHRGKTPKKLGGDWADTGHPVLSAKIIKAGRIVNHQSIRFVSNEMYSRWMKDELEMGDVLITSEAPMGEMFFLTNDAKYCLSQRLYALRANNQDVTPSYLYLWLQTATARAELEGRATGTTVVGIRQAELRRVSVMSPGKKLAKMFENHVFPLLCNLYEKEDETLVLGELRDVLLPKLLSGEITLDDTQSTVEAVAV